MKLPLRLAALVLPALVACSSAETTDDASQEANATSAAPKLCVGVRGNGQYIITHFVSMARIIESYGVVDGMAGGSSGSISTFLYDSMLKNPGEKACAGGTCSDKEYAARLSLTLKSVEGYARVVYGSEEGTSVKDLITVAIKLQQEYEAQGIDHLDPNDLQTAAQKLTKVLQIPEVRTIVNPEVYAMLADTEHLKFNIEEIKAAIKTIGKFSVDDNRLFFRNGVLDWHALANLFGRVGDFYAGYQPTDRVAFKAWLDGCAAPSYGKTWGEAAAVRLASGGTCGDAFNTIVNDYRTKVRASNTAPARLQERIGDPSALTKMTMTSVLEGQAPALYRAARAEFLSGSHPTGDIPFSPNFDDIKFGYWGADATLAKLTSYAASTTDPKMKKASSLGNAKWLDILAVSPAEPGLSHFNELPDGRIAAGGWSDLTPAPALKAIGCERTIYVTREGDESPFATKIAKDLGMTEAQWSDIYDLGNPRSGYNTALSEADGVWCTNWNSFQDLQQMEMAADTWNAPLEIKPSFRGISTLLPYPNTTPRTGKIGCTAGISGGTPYPR